MKLNCDRYRDWKEARRFARQERLEGWHLWFAWYPKRLSHGDCRWLETVWRKRYWHSGYHWSGYMWEYKAK